MTLSVKYFHQLFPDNVFLDKNDFGVYTLAWLNKRHEKYNTIIIQRKHFSLNFAFGCV